MSQSPSTEPLHALWPPDRPVPSAGELARPPGTVDVVVHRADAAYGFLHDNAVAWHAGALFAAWYNCPAWEMAESSCIRGRRSHDGGRTWSEPETIAADADGRGVLYVPAVFLSRLEGLYAFVGNMTGPDLVTRCEVYALDAAVDRWRSLGCIAGPFLPNCAPVPLANGNYLMAGRMAVRAGEKPETPAVALSRGNAVTAPWRVIPIAGRRPLGEPFPETTAWVEGAEVTALVRGGAVCVSRDSGETWSGPFRHNLPAESSKLYAGTLSTRQRYLVWNLPDPGSGRRGLLALAVSRPGGKAMAAMWKLRHGPCAALGAGPEWSYPCAIERAGALHVIYTSEKKHSAMSIVPLRAIRTD